jgi:hypothetical protein
MKLQVRFFYWTSHRIISKINFIEVEIKDSELNILDLQGEVEK